MKSYHNSTGTFSQQSLDTLYHNDVYVKWCNKTERPAFFIIQGQQTLIGHTKLISGPLDQLSSNRSGRAALFFNYGYLLTEEGAGGIYLQR